MIFVDSSELRSNSKTLSLFKAQGVRYVEGPNLEMLTGADILVSSVAIPPQTKTIIMEHHLSAGAILVQVKHDADVLSYDNAREALVRMMEVAGRSSQRMLLFVNNESSENYYEAAMSVAAAWTDRGGSYAELQSAEFFGKWLQIKEKRILKLQQEPKKSVLVAPDRFVDDQLPPLQSLEIIKDFRRALVAMRGVGPKFINEVYHNLIKWEIYPEFWIMLKVFTDEEGAEDIIKLKADRWGNGRRKALREWLKLPPGYNFTLYRQADGSIIEPRKLNSLDKDFLVGVNEQRIKEIVEGEKK
jgi:hypothetical protein